MERRSSIGRLAAVAAALAMVWTTTATSAALADESNIASESPTGPSVQQIADENYSISGHVLALPGNAASWQVLVRADPNYNDAGGSFRYFTVKSDGSYTATDLQNGHYLVEPVPPSDSPVGIIQMEIPVVVDGVEESGVDIDLNSRGTISGTVSGTMAHWGTRQFVVLRDAVTDEELSSGFQMATLDSSGVYSFYGVPNGSYVVEADAVDYGYSGVGYAPRSRGFFGGRTRGTAQVVVVNDSAKLSEIDIVMAASAKIAGTVGAAANPAPLAGTTITAYRWDGASWEDVKRITGWGGYTLSELPEGTYTVGFSTMISNDGNYPYLDCFYGGAGSSGQNQLPATSSSAGTFDLREGAAQTIGATVLKSDGFVDVPESQPFAGDINWLASSGVTTGYSDGSFRPLGNVTRDAFAAFLYRLAGSPEFAPPQAPTFRDVSKTQPFFKEIEWAVSTGVVTGWPDNTYRPEGKITRDAVAAMVYRAAGSPEFTPPGAQTFSDVAKSQPFFKQIEWLRDEGVSTGWSDGTYRPGANITRDAMAAFLHRSVDEGILSQP